MAVTTRNEELAEQTFHSGDFGGTFPGHLLRVPHGVRREGEGTLVSQVLDGVGSLVGTMGLSLPGDLTVPESDARLARLLDTVAEQLDTVLLRSHRLAGAPLLASGPSLTPPAKSPHTSG